MTVCLPGVGCYLPCKQGEGVQGSTAHQREGESFPGKEECDVSPGIQTGFDDMKMQSVISPGVGPMRTRDSC